MQQWCKSDESCVLPKWKGRIAVHPELQPKVLEMKMYFMMIFHDDSENSGLNSGEQ